MKLIVALITFLLALLCIDAVRAQPIGEWDFLSIHLNGDNDSSISAQIEFPLGILIPKENSATLRRLDFGSSDGHVRMWLDDDTSGLNYRLFAWRAETATTLGGTALSFWGGIGAANESGGFLDFQGGAAGSGTGGNGGTIFFIGGTGRGAGNSGGNNQFVGGSIASGANYGYSTFSVGGTPGHFTLTNSLTRSSVYLQGNLEVDGTTWLDGNALVGGTLNVTGATTLATSLTGILKGTSGLVAVASSSDILAAVDFGTVMLKTDAGVTTFYEPSADTDAARGTALATAIAAHAAGDTIVVGPGDYQLSASFTLLTGASLIGQGQPLLYATGLSDALVRLINNDILVEGIDTQTDFVGFGRVSKTPVSVSGIVLRNVTHTPSSASNTSGLQFTESIGGGVQEHTVELSAYNSKFYGGSTLGYGVHMNLDDGSVVNLWDCDVYGATDGLLNKTTSGTSTGVTNIYGGTYESVLDAITSGGGTSNIINVYGATAHGDQADIYGDDGRVNVYWANARYDYIVGNGINLTNEHPIVGHPVIYDGQLKYSAFGGAIDVGLARLSASTLQVTNGSSSRGDLEVADLAYNQSTWNGSFEVPTRNAIRDILEAYTTTGNITISKATPLLQFTDSGGDDYSIDVGAAAASRFRIRNTTDSTTAFDVDGTNRIAMSTSYSPQTAYKVYVQDRQTAASPSAAYAAFSSSMEYLPAAVTTTMNQNQHGYQGGITVYATNGSISGSGVFLGLRGDAGVQLGNALTNSQSTTGLFASMTTTQASGTGGISSLGNAVSTFISAGANTTITTAAHFRVGNSTASGTITTLYGFYADAFSVGTNRYEGWMGTDAGWFFREAGNQINSSAAATLDIDATTTTNFRIGTAIEASISANRMVFNAGASDPYLDWTNSGRLEVGGGILQASGTLVAQSTSFTPYASGYELSVQSAGTAAYIEILANTGAGLGSFFGTEVFSAGSNVHFALYNWEGQAVGSGNFPITFYGGYGSIELAKFDRTGGVVFNDTGEDVDFRIESDTDANNFFSDGGTNRIGIGNAAPGVKLDVTGAIRASGEITSTDTSDLGWAVVDGTDNTACTSQCTNAAVFGLDLAAGATAPVMVGPSSAAADICLCAGAS